MSDTGPTRGAVIPQEIPMAAASWPVAETDVSNASARTTRSGPIIMKTVRTRNRQPKVRPQAPVVMFPPRHFLLADHAAMQSYTGMRLFPLTISFRKGGRFNPQLRQ